MFFGREQELRLLRTLINKDRASIAVVYGRRRVGKSRLISEAVGDKRIWSFEGLENQPKQSQIQNFLFQLEIQTGKRIDKKSSIRSWSEAIALLFPYLKSDIKPVLVFDEFQVDS